MRELNEPRTGAGGGLPPSAFRAPPGSIVYRTIDRHCKTILEGGGGVDQETRAYLNRIEDKVDKLGEEVSETKETVAYLKGRMENGKKNGNDIAVKYLGEGFKVLIAALLAALGIKFLN